MRIHINQLFFALLIFTSSSCTHESGPADTDSFDYLIFVRQGTDDKVFDVRQAPIGDAVSILVTRFQFRDTLFQFSTNRDDANRDAFTALDDALHRRISIYADSRGSNEPTGQRALLYMTWAGQRYEITNQALKVRLLVFERMVHEKFTPTR